MQLCVLYHFLFPCACIEQIAYLLRRTCGGKSSVSVIGIGAAVININEHKIRLDTVIKADRVIGLARHDIFAVRIFCRRKQCAELFSCLRRDSSSCFRILSQSICCFVTIAGLSGESPGQTRQRLFNIQFD